MRRLIPLLLLLALAPPPAAAGIEPGCAEACLRERLAAAMQRLLRTTPDPARQAEIMTAQVLWQAYRDLHCGLDPAREAACQRRQTGWRIEEIEAGLRR
jgi:hypothetical protein